MAELKNVTIFAVGTWNRMKFVESDLQEIAKNTNKLIKTKSAPPLKLGHSTNQILKGQTDGDPAIGEAINYRVDGVNLMADFVNMPDIIHQTIEKKLFKQVSIELDFIENFGWFAKAVALLGADIPAVKTLDDLNVYLSEQTIEQDGSNISLTFSEPIINKEGFMPEVIEKVETPSNVNVTINQDEDLKQKYADSQKELAELKAFKDKSIDKDKQIEELKLKEKDRNFTDQKQDILTAYRADVKAGKLIPATFDKIEKHLDEQKSDFTENSDLTISYELNREIIEEVQKTTMDFTEQSNDSSNDDNTSESPDVAIENAIADVQAGTDMDYFKAKEVVRRSKPKLFTEYYEWTNKISEGGI